MGRLVGGRQARLRLGSHRAMCFLDQKCRIMSFNGALSASAKHVMSTSGSEGRPEGSTVGDAGVGVSTMSPLVAGLEAEVQRLLDGESSFNVLNDLCARQDPPVAPISDHYSFNNGDVGAVHQALQIGGALSAQVRKLAFSRMGQCSVGIHTLSAHVFCDCMHPSPRHLFIAGCFWSRAAGGARTGRKSSAAG